MISIGGKQKRKWLTNDLLRKAASHGSKVAEDELNRRLRRYSANAEFMNAGSGK